MRVDPISAAHVHMVNIEGFGNSVAVQVDSTVCSSYGSVGKRDMGMKDTDRLLLDTFHSNFLEL